MVPNGFFPPWLYMLSYSFFPSMDFQGRQLALLSKDFSRADISTTEFLING